MLPKLSALTLFLIVCFESIYTSCMWKLHCRIVSKRVQNRKMSDCLKVTMYSAKPGTVTLLVLKKSNNLGLG
jgi:hypothetical protein